MRPRVLHVVEAIEGGVARHLVNLTTYVDAEHLVVLPPERVGGVTDIAAFGAMERAGARLELLDMRRAPFDRRTVAAVPALRRTIRGFDPDVVHGHSSIGGAVARIAAVGSRSARVYTPHGLFPSRVAYLTERALGRFTDRLIAVSVSEAELARRQRLVRPDRIVVIPNGIDVTEPPPASLNIRAALGFDAHAPLIGTVARLVPQKAPEVFVDACRRVAATRSDACFALVGDGPLASTTQAQVAASGIAERFLVLRDCPNGEALMSQFDVFVLSSRYEAGATYAVMEAMRAATPVVVTDVVGNTDAVEPGRSGFVVRPEDSEAIAEVVVQLVNNPSLRATVGQAGRARVAERFDVRTTCAALAELYRTLASERPRQTSHQL
ncbi:MAG: glycosyltransferase [Actinobacteria bacterium]|nr:glycosyltransferase [Actinomycetota bacterium]